MLMQLMLTSKKGRSVLEVTVISPLVKRKVKRNAHVVQLIRLQAIQISRRQRVPKFTNIPN